MNQLNIINGFSALEVEAMKKVNEHLKPYVQAKNEKKIIHYDKQESLTKIYAIVIKTIELSGENKKYNLDNQQTKNVSGFIYDLVIEQYKAATLSELDLAFIKGLIGEYGDFVGFGVITFTKWLKGYYNSPKREQAMKEWFKYQTPTTEKPMTKFFEQNLQIAKYFFSICEEKNSERFHTIINHEDNVMHLPSIYEFLYANYQISFTDESKEIIKKKAKIKYNNYIKKSGLKDADAKGYQNIITSVIDNQNKTFDNYVKTQALIFLTLKLKQKGKTFDNLKRIN
jgi:hypothetical protein